MDEAIKLPFYARLTVILLCLILFCFIFYIGQGIIIPILLAFIFAILLRPVVLFLKRKLRFPHVLSVIASVSLFVLVIVGIVAIISVQVSDIVSDFNKIERNLSIHARHIQIYIRDNFHVSSRDQNKYFDDATADSFQKGKGLIGSTLMSFSDTLLNITLIPIYMFLILLYRTHFMLFLSKVFRKEHHLKLQDILIQVTYAVKNYIIGLIIEMIGVIVLTTVGLMVIGVEYAILLGMITGILNLIPYIGILFAGALTIVVSLGGSTDLSIIIGVIVVNIIVQIIDNNILVPLIVNSKVQINAFVSIVGIIIGGGLAGISGMFLAIPIIAVLKVIFDRIDYLEPWGYLMGDNLPKTYKWKNIQLPLYDFDNTPDNISDTNGIPGRTFTETNTNGTENNSSANLM
jgi:predicted PurR-regulated permease PerM